MIALDKYDEKLTHVDPAHGGDAAPRIAHDDEAVLREAWHELAETQGVEQISEE